MRSIPLYAFLVVTVVFVAGCISNPPSQEAVAKNFSKESAPENFTQETAARVAYENSLYSLKRPADWELEENQDFTYFKTSAEEDSNGFQENVVVHMVPIAPGQTLIGFFEDSISEFMETAANFTIVGHGEDAFGSIPAYRIVYFEGETGFQKKYLQVFAVKDGKGYIVTYSAPPETFDKYLPQAESIMESYGVK